MESDYKKMATDLLNTGMWDQGRLRFILECIEKNKPIYKTDKAYLESINEQLEDKIQKLQASTVRITEPKKDHTRTLISDKDNPRTLISDKDNPRTLISDKDNPRTLISDKDLDNIIDKQKLKTVETNAPKRKNKSFFARLFSR